WRDSSRRRPPLEGGGRRPQHGCKASSSSNRAARSPQLVVVRVGDGEPHYPTTGEKNLACGLNQPAGRHLDGAETFFREEFRWRSKNPHGPTSLVCVAAVLPSAQLNGVPPVLGVPPTGRA